MDHNKLREILKEMGIPDHLICLLGNLYAGQEATVGHGTDWLQIGKGVCQGSILSPCLFNFYAEYILRNAGLEEAQAGIKIAGRNINNLRNAEGFPGGSEVKASAYNVGDLGLILGQEDPLEKEMATHSSILAWRIPWMEEPGEL